MMTGVACFCGCVFSFHGDTGPCPNCGRVANVTAGPVPELPDVTIDAADSRSCLPAAS
jgi:hypothetical protein